MRFIDRCKIHVIAGSGGNGCVAFLREKHMPHGGPSGGDGGKGGDIVFIADPGKTTLIDLSYQRTLRAKPGEHGRGKDQYGKGGDDLEVRVPLGTQVFDDATGELLVDVQKTEDRFVIAKGGRGGRGNIHFATPYDRAPRRAEPGEPGQEIELRLELKVMADAGLLGFPNVGKSTFIRACSRAQPKVADYPFTTLTPHLGVVRISDEASFVLADIPGLIPGAAEGAGLGVRFLQHVERTRVLLHLVTLDPSEGREPLADYDALMHELRAFDSDLAERPMLVALSKADVTEVREAYPGLARAFAKRGIHLYLVSAATQEGVRDLVLDLYRVTRGELDIERPRNLGDGSADKQQDARPSAKKRAKPEKPRTTKPKKAGAAKAGKARLAKTATTRAAKPKKATKGGGRATVAKKPVAQKRIAEKRVAKKRGAEKRVAKTSTKRATARKRTAPKKGAAAKRSAKSSARPRPRKKR